MSINHHIADDLLLSYAAGSLAEGWSLAVATHLSLCADCRARLAAAEAAGGQMLETIDGGAVEAGSWTALRGRLAPAPPATTPAKASAGEVAVLPKPLRDYVGGDVEAIRWSAIGTAGAQFRIKTADRETQVRLLRIPAGKPVPEHTHRGRELTVVLSGAFSDGVGRFARGGVEDADDSIEHIPTATPEADCICLAVTDAPLRFRSLLVRALQPFLGI
ncbi:MAG: ChrR family anti-sigma-E factor [Devosia sp.]